MITTLKRTIENTPDINKTLRTITLYSWISAGVLFACYVYFIGGITFSVIKERGLQQDTKALISSMGQEEVKYLAVQKTLTKGFAEQAGFIEPARVSFAQPQQAVAFNVGQH